MSKYRVVDTHHGQRIAVHDQYGRCVELVPIGMTDQQLDTMLVDNTREWLTPAG